jgi:hypothetical protein
MEIEIFKAPEDSGPEARQRAPAVHLPGASNKAQWVPAFGRST